MGKNSTCRRQLIPHSIFVFFLKGSFVYFVNGDYTYFINDEMNEVITNDFS